MCNIIPFTHLIKREKTAGCPHAGRHQLSVLPRKLDKGTRRGARELGSVLVRLTPPYTPGILIYLGCSGRTACFSLPVELGLRLLFMGFMQIISWALSFFMRTLLGGTSAFFYSIQPYGITTVGAEDVARPVAGIRGFVLTLSFRPRRPDRRSRLETKKAPRPLVKGTRGIPRGATLFQEQDACPDAPLKASQFTAREIRRLADVFSGPPDAARFHQSRASLWREFPNTLSVSSPRDSSRNHLFCK